MVTRKNCFMYNFYLSRRLTITIFTSAAGYIQICKVECIFILFFLLHEYKRKLKGEMEYVCIHFKILLIQFIILVYKSTRKRIYSVK